MLISNRQDAYPNANKLVPATYGMRSSMKGAAHMMPIREQFVYDIKAAYDGFIDTCEDAAPSVVAWELYDPVKVATLEQGSFANRGYHFNSLVMPMVSTDIPGQYPLTDACVSSCPGHC